MKKLQEWIIHMLGGKTEYEYESALNTAAADAEARTKRLTNQAYTDGQRLVIFRYYEHAYKIKGCSKQTWIDNVWSMMERDFVGAGGIIKN